MYSSLLKGLMLLMLMWCTSKCSAQATWNDPSGRFFERTNQSQQLLIKQSGANKYTVDLYGKTWKLIPKGNRLHAVIYLNASQISKQVRMLAPNGQWVQMPYKVALVAAKKPAFAETLVLEYDRDKEEFTETHQFFGSAFNYMGKPVRYFDNFDPIFGNRYVRIPDVNASADFAQYITKHKGKVEFPLRTMYKKELNLRDPLHLTQWKVLTKGHNYLIISHLGNSKSSPEEINRLLTQNIEEIFPGRAKLSSGEGFSVGNEYTLLINDSLDTAEFLFPTARVRLSAITPYYFEFETVPGKHALRGTAKHGIFVDGNQEFWMFQQGRGPADESTFDAGKACGAALVMWPNMAVKMSSLMNNGYR